MGLSDQLAALGLEANTYVLLSYTEGVDVWHISDSYVEDALNETESARMLAELLSHREYTVYTRWETNILQEMRNENLLDDYEYDYTFADFVTGVILDNNFDYAWLDTTTTQYDYKRGRCDVVARVLVPAYQVMDYPDAVQGWRVSVETEDGMLTLN